MQRYKDDEYFLFSDVDTVFCDKSKCTVKNIWNLILNELKNNDICYALSPFNFAHVGNLENKNNTHSCSHISKLTLINDDKYCQTSFLMGNINGLKKINAAMLNYEAYDLNHDTTNRVLPHLNDQSYFNKVIYEGNLDLKIKANWYVHDAYVTTEINYKKLEFSEFEDWLSPYCICMQKINLDIKRKERNSVTFNNEI